MKQLVILLLALLAALGFAYTKLPERFDCTPISPLALPHISNDTPGLMLDLPDGAGKYRYMDMSISTTKRFGYAGKTRDWNAQNAREFCAYLGTQNGQSCEFYTEESPRYAYVSYKDNYIVEVPREEVNVEVKLVQNDGTHIGIFPSAGDDRDHAQCHLVGALHLLGAAR